MSVIAGLDPSSSKLAVVAEYDDGRVAAHRWFSSKPRWEPENCISAFEWVTSHLSAPEHAKTIWVEEPLVGRSAHSTIVQSLTSGAACAALLRLGWDVRMVNVSTWKKRVVGSGRADKDDIKRSVEHRWPEAWKLVEGDGDLIDAAAIALYGRGVLSRSKHLLDDGGGLRRSN